MMKKIRHLFFLLLSFGLYVLIQSCSSTAPEALSLTREAPAAMPTATFDLPVPTPASTSVPGIPEQRRITLEFPPNIRAGDSDRVRLTLEMDEQGNIVPTAEIDGNVVTGDVVEIQNLYDTHYVLAESRLDMAGMQVLPAETISEPLLPGEAVTFYWSIRPSEAGEYRGTVWLYLHFIPKAGGKELTRTISAQFIEVNATTFLGVKAGTARWLGAIGSLISGILGMPLIDEVLKWLWGKAKKK